jgi:signal transduction histidine kinase
LRPNLTHRSPTKVKLKNVLQAGVDETLDQELRRRVVSSNVVFVTAAIILFIVVALNADGYWARGVRSFRAAIPLLLLCVSLGGIVLNHLKLFFLAKLIFFLSWSVMITAFPIWRAEQSVYGYFIHPIFGIVSSTMVLLMFSFRRETIAYLVFLIFSILITVFSFEFVSAFDPTRVSETVMKYTTSFTLHIYPILFSIFFNLVLIYILRINEKFFEMQHRQHEIIVDQNKQLFENRLKLEQSNNELENRVRERTSELIDHNNRLTEYAFFHAHVLRAPVSRIRGLLNLMNLPITPEEEMKVRDMLTQSMKELDDTIRLMNDKLQATNIAEQTIPN